MVRYYRRASKKLKKLGEALNKQQMALYENQHEILRLRIAIVQRMMEFESEIKLINADFNRAKNGDVQERLHSSWPNLMETGSDGFGEILHASWPSNGEDALLNNEEVRHSWPSLEVDNIKDGLSFEIHTILEEQRDESSSDSDNSQNEIYDVTQVQSSEDVSLASSVDFSCNEEERLLVEIHTIHEDQSGESSSDSESQHEIKNGATQVMSTMQQMTVPQNLPPSSSRFEVEPDGGRLSFPSKFGTTRALAPSIKGLKAPVRQPHLPSTSAVVEQALHCITDD
jgi:hypothetical protein